MIYALFKLDERSKKIILVICALFISVLLIFGFIYVIIEKYMKRQAKKVDQYMYDLCFYKIITTTRKFKNAVLYYENKTLYARTRWALRIIILTTSIAFVLGIFAFKDTFIVFKDFFTLIPILKWQTIGEVNEKLKEVSDQAILISGPSWLPTSILPSFISKNPDYSSISLWISTIYYVINIVFGFRIITAILGYIAKVHHGFKMAKEVFQKDLSKLDMNIILANDEHQKIIDRKNENESDITN